MLSIKKNFLFIHYPKTGGNSVQSVLMEHSEDEVLFNRCDKTDFEIKTTLSRLDKSAKHAYLDRFNQKLEPDVYARLFKFSIIRNPWERIISFCFWVNRNQLQGTTDLSKKEILAFLEKMPRKPRFGSLRQFIRLSPANQTDEGALDADIDYLMRYEHLEEDFAHVCKQIDIPVAPLPQYNKTEHMHYSRYYDDELVGLVAERYREEITFGGYAFEWR